MEDGRDYAVTYIVYDETGKEKLTEAYFRISPLGLTVESQVIDEALARIPEEVKRMYHPKSGRPVMGKLESISRVDVTRIFPK